jgi:AP-1 complex subunit gamma-1
VTTSPTVNIPQGTGQSNQQLLEELFGSGPAASPSSNVPTTPAGQPQKSSVNDILGLFDSTPATPSASSPVPASSAVQHLFTPGQDTRAAQPAPTTPPQPSSPTPRLQSYTAYEKNELKITLTPQPSAQKAGVVNVMARFQVSGSTAASGINFQAAVPKVGFLWCLWVTHLNSVFHRPNNCKCFLCQVQKSGQEQRSNNRCAWLRPSG